MVAVGLLAVIIVGLLAMFYQTQRAFRAGLTQTDVLESGRAAMEFILRDVQEASAAAPYESTINFEVLPPVGYRSLRLTLPGNDVLNTVVHDVSFLRRFNDDWEGECYRVSNAVPGGVGALYRLHVTNRSDLIALSEYTRTNEFGPGKPNTNYMRVADGVLHFRIIPFDSAGHPLDGDGPGILVSQNKERFRFFNDALPAFVDVELAILEPRSLEQYKSRADPVKRQYLESQAGRMHFFKQRVQLRNAPKYHSSTNAISIQ